MSDPSAPSDAADVPQSDLPTQLQVRRAKRDRILAAGGQAYPVAVDRTHTLAEVRDRWRGLETGEETDDVVGVAGRVMFLRTTGKLAFATLQEMAGLGFGVDRMVMLFTGANIRETILFPHLKPERPPG